MSSSQQKPQSTNQSPQPPKISRVLRNAQSYFQSIDKNRDGFVSRQQIRNALLNVGVPATPALVNVILKQCDTNKDGRISLSEFKVFSTKQDQKLKKLFNSLDKSNTGVLNKTDIKQALEMLGNQASDDTVGSLIQKMDYNKTGTINYEEFLYFYYLIPSQNIRSVFNYWEKAESFDIGESMTIPEERSTNSSISPLVTLTAGGIAGAISRTSTAPLDRLKVILQAQTTGKTTVLQGLRGIYNQGGLRAFFRGNGTNVVKIIPQTAIKFLMYDKIKELVCKNPKQPSTLQRLLSGAIAGFTSQTMIYPLEITKTRLALAPKGTYNGILDTIKQIYSKEGARALYKGWGASVLGIIPYASIDLAVFNILRDAYSTRYSSDPKVLTLLSCGALSGICGQLVSYPLALIRTRLQSQGLPGRKVQYSGMLDCAIKTLRRDGFAGLYRGIVPNFMKSVPAISISYAVFETAKKSLTGRN